MQVKIKKASKQEFKPFTLKIKVESYEELCELWHRTNKCSIKEIITNYDFPYPNLSLRDLWIILDKKIDKIKGIK